MPLFGRVGGPKTKPATDGFLQHQRPREWRTSVILKHMIFPQFSPDPPFCLFYTVKQLFLTLDTHQGIHFLIKSKDDQTPPQIGQINPRGTHCGEGSRAPRLPSSPAGSSVLLGLKSLVRRHASTPLPGFAVTNGFQRLSLLPCFCLVTQCLLLSQIAFSQPFGEGDRNKSNLETQDILWVFIQDLASFATQVAITMADTNQHLPMLAPLLPRVRLPNPYQEAEAPGDDSQPICAHLIRCL